MEKVTKDGVITIENACYGCEHRLIKSIEVSKGIDTTVKVVEGMQLPPRGRQP